MDEKELRELQDPDAWDLEEQHEAPATAARKARAVVSVAFPRDDFDRVEEYADEHGLKISELIRQATLQTISRSAFDTATRMSVMSAGGAIQMTAYFQELAPATVGHALAFTLEGDAIAS